MHAAQRAAVRRGAPARGGLGAARRRGLLARGVHPAGARPPRPAAPRACQVLDSQPGRDEIQLKTLAPGEDAELIFILTLTATDPANPLRSIRVLPAAGGICAGDLFTEVGGAAACSPPQRYRPYLLAHAQIMFMPQFLAGLRPYRWAQPRMRSCTGLEARVRGPTWRRPACRRHGRA